MFVAITYSVSMSSSYLNVVQYHVENFSTNEKKSGQNGMNRTALIFFYIE